MKPVNRRHFLRHTLSGSLLALAAPSLLTSCASRTASSSGATLMEPELNLGLHQRFTSPVQITSVDIVRAQGELFVKIPDGSPAANYVIDTYKTPFDSQAEARKAVRFETRLEFGMEGHRFFDLVRWGIAAETLNAYVAKEKQKRIYLQGATFTKGRNEYCPIPLAEIINSTVGGKNTLEQNNGY